VEALKGFNKEKNDKLSCLEHKLVYPVNSLTLNYSIAPLYPFRFWFVLMGNLGGGGEKHQNVGGKHHIRVGQIC